MNNRRTYLCLLYIHTFTDPCHLCARNEALLRQILEFLSKMIKKYKQRCIGNTRDKVKLPREIRYFNKHE